MNLQALPEGTQLRKLLATCKLDHELVMTECADGALIMDCLDCPFRRSLDRVEEEFVRQEDFMQQEQAKIMS